MHNNHPEYRSNHSVSDYHRNY